MCVRQHVIYDMHACMHARTCVCLCVYVRVYVCACVCERERESEKEREFGRNYSIPGPG